MPEHDAGRLRALPDHDDDRTLAVAAGAASIAFVAAALVVSALRIAYPHELEFMGGAMLDLAARARDGLSLYRPPGLGPTSFVYAPGWFLVVGALGKGMPLRSAARLVGAAANLGSCALVAALARRLEAPRGRVLACVAVYAAGYALTGCWYDLERVDALASALVVAGVWAWTSPGELAGGAAGGLLLGAALACKQTVLPVALAMAAADLVGRRWRRAALFALGAGVLPCGLWLSAGEASRAWFSFYGLVLPRRHGVEASRVLLLARDLGRGFLLTAASAAALGARLPGAPRRRPSKIAAPLAGAFVGAALSRLHDGGWPNVLMPWAALAAAALAELPTARPRGAWLCYALVGQLALAGPALLEAVPSAEHRRAAERLTAIVRALEARGEVWVLGRGHVTASPHVHVAALADLFRAGYGLPDEIEAALRRRRFAAVVIDDGDELSGAPEERLLEAVVRNYAVAGEVDAGPPLPSGCLGRPTWVLVPRAQPLEDAGEPLTAKSLMALLLREQRRASRAPWRGAADVRLDPPRD